MLKYKVSKNVDPNDINLEKELEIIEKQHSEYFLFNVIDEFGISIIDNIVCVYIEYKDIIQFYHSIYALPNLHLKHYDYPVDRFSFYKYVFYSDDWCLSFELPNYEFYKENLHENFHY